MFKAFAAVTCLAALAAAADAPPEDSRSVSVTAIFSQLLHISYPHEFHRAFENTTGNFYIQESVLAGETVEHWTQMLTVTGTQGLALNPQATPERFVERLARGFRTHCPDSFSETPLADEPIEGVDSYAALLSCGSLADSDSPRSEVALMVIFRGQRDYYSIQWAERGAPSSAAVTGRLPQWLARLKRLSPIRLCPKLDGEGPPYVSCLNAGSPPASPAAPEPNRQKE